MKKSRILLIIIMVIIFILLTLFLTYKNGLKSVNKEEQNEDIVIEIPDGYGVKKIAETLEENNVIKNKFVFAVYVKLNNISNLQAGKYLFSNGKEDVKQIVSKMSNGEVFNEEVKITFVEGKNMRYIAKLISEKTNNTEEDVFNLLEDEEYINSLIEKYWFLTDEIKNDKIYYPLEGYLLPDTYTFENKDVTVQTIFNIILNFTDKYLTTFKDDIQKSNLTVHQVLTLASICELEGESKEDRAKIIGVFYNRLSKKMSLGSDVTSYYAFKVDLSDRNLTKEELNTENPYNTRGPNMNGKIPIGPISNPSKIAIEATINYTPTDALYFVADKNKKVYFSKNYEEHTSTINKLKKDGLWFTYEN